MKKLIIVLTGYFLLGSNLIVKSDEGMWLPLLVEKLNHADMQKMGLKLSADEIYSINHSSIKDAIVKLNIGGGFCTGSVISDEGLLLTNHHCALDYIQQHSTVEADYVKDGFLAKEKREELRNDNISVTFLIRMEDVTQKILPNLKSGMTEEERNNAIEEISTKLEEEAIKETYYTAEVKSFFNGNEYYLFVYETFKDVRLVWAPPKAIGNFGGSTDNWMWPRHVGDFSLFRIYTSPEGAPAGYNKKNIPLKPKYYLPISLKGVEKGDFSMLYGFPGNTDRFQASFGIKKSLNIYNPTIVNIRTKKLDIIKEDMDKSPEIKMQYIAKYEESANYWKFYILQTKTLKSLDTYNKKVTLENEFNKWCGQDPARKTKYGNVVNDLSNAFNESNKYLESLLYLSEGMQRGCEIFQYANTFEELYNELKLNLNEDKLYNIPRQLIYSAKNYFKNYNPDTDKKIVTELLKMYYENTNIPLEQRPVIFQTIEKKYKGNTAAFVQDVFNESVFASKDKVLNFLIEPDYKILEKDLGFIAMQSFYSKWKELFDSYNKARSLQTKGNRIFLAGLMEMEKNSKLYPDGNNTLRLTYGKVTDYNPTGTKNYNYFTTLSELIAKENPNNPEEFSIPDKLKELYKNKDFGKYGKDGDLVVCFLTNEDTHGGNSGSPVLNGNGEIVGVAFDINEEASVSPIAFDPNYQRSICADIRFMLFMLDKYYGANNIIQELSIR